MSDDRPSVYQEGNRVVYRGSAVGGCIRALVAARLGYDPLPFDDAAELRMAEGVLHEPVILDQLEQRGWVVTDQQREVEVVIGDQLVIRGHIDGIGHQCPGERVVEVKAMGDDPFKEWLAKRFESNPRYAYQLSTYMAGLDMPGLFVVKNRNSGVIDILEVDEPPIPIAQIKARVARVEAIARSGDFPECDTKMTWGCPYRYLHEEVSLPGMAAVDDAEVDALAAAYDRARATVAQAETMKRLARDRLADVVRDRGKVRTGAWSVSCSLQRRTSVDMGKLRAEVDVSPYEMTNELETVRVTAVRAVEK